MWVFGRSGEIKQRRTNRKFGMPINKESKEFFNRYLVFVLKEIANYVFEFAKKLYQLTKLK